VISSLGVCIGQHQGVEARVIRTSWGGSCDFAACRWNVGLDIISCRVGFDATDPSDNPRAFDTETYCLGGFPNKSGILMCFLNAV